MLYNACAQHAKNTNEIKVVACGISMEVTGKHSHTYMHKASIIHDMTSAIILLGI